MSIPTHIRERSLAVHKRMCQCIQPGQCEHLRYLETVFWAETQPLVEALIEGRQACPCEAPHCIDSWPSHPKMWCRECAAIAPYTTPEPP